MVFHRWSAHVGNVRTPVALSGPHPLRTARPFARPPRVPASHPRRGWARPRRVDAQGTAPQLRLPALGQRRSAGRDLPPGRSQQHSRDGAGLPQADQAGATRRSDSHGPNIQRMASEWPRESITVRSRSSRRVRKRTSAGLRCLRCRRNGIPGPCSTTPRTQPLGSLQGARP